MAIFSYNCLRIGMILTKEQAASLKRRDPNLPPLNLTLNMEKTMKPTKSEYEVTSSKDGTKILDIAVEFGQEIISFEQHGNVVEIDSKNLNRVILTLVDIWNVDRDCETEWG